MPLLWISLAFLTGIILASIFPLPAWMWFVILVIILLLFVLSRFLSSRFPIPHSPITLHPYIFILPSFLILGAWRYQAAQPYIDAFHIAFYNDRDYDVLVTGTLNEPPDVRDSYTNLKIKVEAVDTGSGA